MGSHALALAVGIFGALGVVSACRSIVRWWKLQTRGEFHCPTCNQVSPLPKDE